jgi:murein DD-endopeptidase MepM/ murein hydrolase activator NlpD
MFYCVHPTFYRVRLYIIGIPLITGSLLLALLLISVSMKDFRQAENRAPIGGTLTASMSESPNAVTRGMTAAIEEYKTSSSSIENAIGNGSRAVLSAIDQVWSLFATSGKLIVTSVFRALSFTVQSIVDSIVFVLNIPGKVLASVDTAFVSSVIKPGNNARLPIIEPTSYVYAEATPLTSNNTTSQAPPPSTPESAWPIAGRVTTPFGAPHRPYQPVHTGLDISDGKPSGVTKVYPFKPGIVIETKHSRFGYGNHVIVDHGDGLTSLYGHLAAIHVKEGQRVDNSLSLGLKGSTGSSTGPHLHFEIRKNGRPVNPYPYLNGRH